ncbi:MAG: hypothetical protein ACI8ZN_001325 [Bacteroidia bacterium]|jgi:hypothetical protein
MRLTKKTFTAFIVLILISVGQEVLAQCPMCRGAVESALQNEGVTVGIGLNKGIMYLLAMPYLMVGVVGLVWYRKNRRFKA